MERAKQRTKLLVAVSAAAILLTPGLARACAGLASGRIIVSLPGSEAAVRLAMEKLLIPELPHMVQQANK